MTLKIYIYLFLLFVFFHKNTLGGTIQNNGLTLIDFTLSQENLNISTTLNSLSVTINFTLQGSPQVPLDAIEYGAINFINGETLDYTIPWSQWNYLGTSSSQNTVSISVCVPLYTVNFCGLNTGSQLCVFNIQALHSNKVSSYFKSSQIATSFPHSTITIYSSPMKPKLIGFNVTVHPVLPLVSFTIEAEQYNQGFNYITIDINNGTLADEVNLESNEYTFSTSNGLYYIEALLSPETSGYHYTSITVTIDDLQGNFAVFNTQYLKTHFNVSSFTLPKNSNTILSQLFDISQPNNQQYQATHFQSFIINASMADYTFPIIISEINFGNCFTYYLNSTFINIYCAVPAFDNSMSIQYQLSTANSYTFSLGYIDFQYINTDYDKPILSDISYSVPSIDKLDPFYIEINYTFTSYEAYFYQLQIEIPTDMFFSTSSLISGTINNGTVSIILFFDSFVNSLTSYYMSFEDSKGLNILQPKLKGIPTTPRTISNQLTLDVIISSNIIDLTNSTSASVPFILSTISLPDTYLTYSGFSILPSVSINSGISLFTSGQSGGVLSTNETSNGLVETIYQSYFQVFNNNSLWKFGGGDYTMILVYEYGNTVLSPAYTRHCFTIIKPEFQPTIITEFSVNFNNPVDSSQVDVILYTLVTKGASVEVASINFYQTSVQSEFYNPEINPCYIIEPYNYDTLVTYFECPIQISKYPSSTQAFYLELVIQGMITTIYNVQLQEYNYPSYLEIVGPEDTGLVPNITTFQTSFDSLTNTITINYTLTTPLNIAVNFISLVIFNKFIMIADNNLNAGIENQIFVNETSNTFTINLCTLEGFQYDWQSIGIYVSIPSSIPNINYQFPYEYLMTLDDNQLHFPINLSVCDYNGPRLFDFGILDHQESYDTTDQDIPIQIYFGITDDISGFNELVCNVQSTDTTSYYFNSLTIQSNNTLLSGNLNNGRYIYNFTIPKYAIGNFTFQIQYLIDNAGNSRLYTNQNLLLLSTSPFYFTATSRELQVDTNLPYLSNLVNDYNFPFNNFYASISGNASSVTMIPNTNGYYNTTHSLLPNDDMVYQLENFNPNLISSTYTFSICLNSYSLSTNCYSWLTLKNLGFSYTFTTYNPFSN